jgi:hypothetical protein
MNGERSAISRQLSEQTKVQTRNPMKVLPTPIEDCIVSYLFLLIGDGWSGICSVSISYHGVYHRDSVHSSPVC